MNSPGMSNGNRTGLSRHLWREVRGYSGGRVRNFDWTGLIGSKTINNLCDIIKKIIWNLANWNF